MFEAFMIYLYLTIGNLIGTLGVVSFIIGGGFVSFAFILGLGWTESNVRNKYDNNASSYCVRWWEVLHAKALLTVVVISVVLKAMYPSPEDIKYIIGGAVAWNTVSWVADNDEAKRIPDSVLKAMNTFLINVDTDSANKVIENVKDSVDRVADSAEKVIGNVNDTIPVKE